MGRARRRPLLEAFEPLSRERHNRGKPMRFVTFSRHGRTSPGLWLDGGRVLDLDLARRLAGEGTELPSVLAIIEGGEVTRAAVQRLARRAQDNNDAVLPAAEVQLEAPIPRPIRNVFCVGRNYLEHAQEGARVRGEELKLPKAPTFFTKAYNTINRDGGDVRLDPQLTKILDYEVELAVVIGKSGRDIAPEKALDHVFGYTIANDITARDLQRLHEQWFKGKSLDTTLPIGPWIVDAEEIGDPTTLELSLTVNGEERQRARASAMMFDIPAIIAWLSKGLTLDPGDIIATGTPSGVGYAMVPPQPLKGGDVVVCSIDRIGTLTSRIVEV